MTLKKILKNLRNSEQIINTILGALVVLVLGLVVLYYFHNKTTVNKEPAFKTEIQEENQRSKDLPTIHKVKSGERLWDIAVSYYGSGYNWVDIAKENKLSNPNLIFTDQELTIPSVPAISVSRPQTKIESVNYTITKGDSLWNIAVRAYGDGYKWTELAKANKLVNPGLIHQGNVLIIPR